MSRTTDRLVRNQILFREVNERVREVVDGEDGRIEFLCECSNPDCIETLVLTNAFYEHVRSRATLFVLAEGHERLEVERVVDRGPGYVLVEKHVGADLLRESDPRSAGT